MSSRLKAAMKFNGLLSVATDSTFSCTMETGLRPVREILEESLLIHAGIVSDNTPESTKSIKDDLLYRIVGISLTRIVYPVPISTEYQSMPTRSGKSAVQFRCSAGEKHSISG
jgi:hypothetical protein